AGEHSTVGLPGYPARFEHELAPAPIEFLTMDFKHCFWLLSWFCATKAMGRTGLRPRLPRPPLPPHPPPLAGEGGESEVRSGHSVWQSLPSILNHGVRALGCRAGSPGPTRRLVVSRRMQRVHHASAEDRATAKYKS